MKSMAEVIAERSEMAEIIRDAIERTPYWTDDPATHQDPYANATYALRDAGYGKVREARGGW